MSHSVSESSDQYDSAVESLNESTSDSFIESKAHEQQQQQQEEEYDTTIPYQVQNEEIDEVATFQQSLTKTKTNQEIYQDELGDEIQRVATQLSNLSRKFSHKSNIKEKEETQETQATGDTSIDEEEEILYDPKTMDWDSADDPANPYNWPQWKRWACTMSVAFLCLVISLGSSIYVDALPEMEAKWGISQTLGLGGLTLYLVGLAFGPAIAAPLSELFGRKIVYCSTLPISMCFIAGVGVSKNIGQVLVLRFFAGFTSSAALAIGGGTITDIWRPRELGLAMTLFCLAPLAGPVIGPIIGGFVGENMVSSDPKKIGGLRWVMWVDLFFAAAVFFPLYIMPETYKQIIMKKRIKERGLKMKPGLPLMTFLVVILFITLLKPAEMLVVEPIVLILSVYTAFIFAVLFGFFEGFPVIFRGVGLGLLIGAATYLYIDKYVFFKKHEDGYVGQKDKDGNIVPATPESRLITCKLGAVAMSPALFWLGWTGKYHHIHWMAPVAAGVPFGFALILIFFSILTYFSMAYPPLSVASALAANNMLRYLVSSVFPLFTVQMLDKLGVGWGMSVFAFIALALAPVPWIFTIYGAKIRKNSKYGWAAVMRQQQEAAEAAKAQEV
ncbi:hypothetical protein CANARDRAFT_67917 [[Candida] arabinofermentans NRRL YB-2248]|uniref:Major facilitator superfamily (MFS) profile domain-containing protein n=1 Tax=[Candida] arabinofermentans NRRL YB-2248 TaxID=983967 RepID=A0A1E4SX87_9ASCO|nr:hypothetical protein CANARDRAFT_67917 [[Candida] arabinofermentans NRRL YB-2248]